MGYIQLHWYVYVHTCVGVMGPEVDVRRFLQSFFYSFFFFFETVPITETVTHQFGYTNWP